jgi:hypothetical protein
MIGGSSEGLMVRNDTLFTVSEKLEDTFVLYSLDYGEHWQVYQEYIFDDHQEAAFRQTNPKFAKMATDGTIYMGNAFQASTWLLEEGSQEFRHRLLRKSGITLGIAMYDKNIGFVSAIIDNYRTFDGWETVDTLSDVYYQDGSHRKFSFDDQIDFINDSIVEGKCFEFESGEMHWGHYNINTDRWEAYGVPDEYTHRYHRVTQDLMYAFASPRNGKGEQSYDVFYRSRDGGLTWENIFFSDSLGLPFGGHKISFHDEMNGYIVGERGRIFMTRDGGDNWHYWDLVDDGQPGPGEYEYGPIKITGSLWFGQTPIFSSLYGNVYHLENDDFFDFDYDKIAGVESTSRTGQTFSWSDSDSNAEYYELQVTTHTRKWDRWLHLSAKERTNSTTITLNNLSEDSTYYWRVLTVKGSQIRESEVRAFTLGEITSLAKPELIDCDVSFYGDMGTFTINWNTVHGADGYLLSFKPSSPSSNPPEDTVVSDTHYIAKTYVGHNFMLGVTAFKGDPSSPEIVSEQSDLCNYSHIYPPVIPITPLCGDDRIDPDVKILWDLPEGMSPGLYSTLEIATDSLFENIIFGSSTAINGAEPPYRLEYSTQYWWRARTFGYMTDIPTAWMEEPCTFITGPNTSVEESGEDYKVISNSGMIEVRSDKMIESLSLIDLTGKQVAQSDNTIISTSNLSTGMYFLLIDGERFMKVLIE